MHRSSRLPVEETMTLLLFPFHATGFSHLYSRAVIDRVSEALTACTALIDLVTHEGDLVLHTPRPPLGSFSKTVFTDTPTTRTS